MGMKIQTFLSLFIYTCVVILHCEGLKLGSVDVVGGAECLDCIDKKQAFSGMRVGIACRSEGGMMKIRSGGRVDEEGRFRVHFLTRSEGVVEEMCSVVLHNGSAGGFSLQLCEAPPRSGSCKMVVNMDEGRHEVHLLGKLFFSSSTCTSGFFRSFPWYHQPKLGQWKKKPFLIFPFPPKCIKPFPLPTEPPPYMPPICDNPPPPPSIVHTTPPSPTPVFLPTPPPPANKSPSVFLHPPPPLFKNPPPIFVPPPSPVFKNPPILLPPPPPELKNPPIVLTPPPIAFKNPPVFETPFTPSSPPPPVMEFMPVPMIPKFLPPKFDKPCPPVYKGPEWFPPKNSGHLKFGSWFPVPP